MIREAARINRAPTWRSFSRCSSSPWRPPRPGRRGPLGGDVGGLAPVDRAGQQAAGPGARRRHAPPGRPRLAGRQATARPVLQRLRVEALDDPLGALAPSAGAAPSRPERPAAPFGGRISVKIPTGAPMVSDRRFEAGPALRPRGDDPRQGPDHARSRATPGARCTSYLQSGETGRHPTCRRRPVPRIGTTSAASTWRPRMRGRRRARRLDHRRQGIADRRQRAMDGPPRPPLAAGAAGRASAC